MILSIKGQVAKLYLQGQDRVLIGADAAGSGARN